MAMDIRISRNYNIEMGALFPRQILALFHILIILSEGVASPVWMPQFLSGGQGRSIRHLPCVSRRSGEQGICMFAYTCLKSNGTHLGTCIDRFYFGSCCKLADTDDLLIENHFPVINNNQVTSPYYPSNTNSMQTFSVQNELHKITENLFPTNTKLSYPTRTTQKVETSTVPMIFGSTGLDTTDKTVVDLAQHLATETYFISPSTEKLFVPVHTSKPNKTEVINLGSNLFTTMISSSGLHSDIKRPTVAIQNTYGATQPATSTTQPFLLSTFQVVHNQGDASSSSSVKATASPPPTTISSNSKFPPTKPAATVGPSTAELISTWTPIKQDVTTPTTIRKNSTDSGKPTQQTTTKKPAKPVKPYTTTRKPTTKKPSTKPAAKPSPATSKPTQTAVKVTTSKPTAPVKKPTQPTKKPSTSKPLSAKPATVTRPSLRPNITSSSALPVKATTYSPEATTTKSNTKLTTKPATSSSSTTPRHPVFSTYVDTTSEVIFTRPGLTTASNQTPGYGITTFRPDLGVASSKPALITGSGLTTFSYVSEGVKDTTLKPMETTTSRFKPSKPGDHSPTVSNEISSSHWTGSPGSGVSEAQEENTNVIFQQVGSTLRPSPSTAATSAKPVDTSSVPFFPDAERPGIPTQWIEMIQTSTKPESPYPSSMTTTTTTTNQATTVMAIFEGLNQSDYTQVCGRRIYPQARVVGGEKSTFGKWPWQISLRQWRTSTYLHKCGAALLNENWAITAAHCVENVPPSDLLLRLGEHDLSTEDEPFGFQERRVQIVASHPQFDPRTFEYDLALLRFYEPVKFQPNIIPVCVPEDNTNFVGQTAYVTGWGRLYEDGPLPSVLQEVSVPVINNTLCENMYRSAGYIEHIPEIFICAGWKKGGFDSCEGDSGGPMVIQRPDKRWLLAGVISWGIGCAEPNQPGVYTRISEFREWIHQILQF